MRVVVPHNPCASQSKDNLTKTLTRFRVNVGDSGHSARGQLAMLLMMGLQSRKVSPLEAKDGTAMLNTALLATIAGQITSRNTVGVA